MSGKKNKENIPMFLTKVKNFTLSMGKAALDGFRTVPEEELERRWEICKSCDKFKEKNGHYVCSLSHGGCGCSLSNDSTKYINKLLYRSSKCPHDPPKWEEYKPPSEE